MVANPVFAAVGGLADAGLAVFGVARDSEDAVTPVAIIDHAVVEGLAGIEVTCAAPLRKWLISHRHGPFWRGGRQRVARQ